MKICDAHGIMNCKACAEEFKALKQRIAELERENARLLALNEKMRQALVIQQDVYRLRREGKPVPWGFAEKILSEALSPSANGERGEGA